MDVLFLRKVNVIAWLVLIAAITQTIYTGIALGNREGLIDFAPPRQLLWGFEALVFVIMAAFAGAALVQAERLQLAWSAIAMAAVLNVVQVGVGLTMFGPFREVAAQNEALMPLAASVVAFSFMVYNAAKVLLAFALIVLGTEIIKSGAKVLGGLSVVIGVVAMAANTASMAFGRDVFGEAPIAGGMGVLATVLLALCLFRAARQEISA